MRLAVMGTPDFAVPALRGLHAAGHDIAAVYCQPPRPAGRGQAVRKCPMHLAAEALGLPVRTPARLRRDAGEHAAFAALGLDAAVVAAYGLILPEPMLAAPARGVTIAGPEASNGAICGSCVTGSSTGSQRPVCRRPGRDRRHAWPASPPR
jgi:methionyl-tRNA formyltransferase